MNEEKKCFAVEDVGVHCYCSVLTLGDPTTGANPKDFRLCCACRQYTEPTDPAVEAYQKYVDELVSKGEL